MRRPATETLISAEQIASRVADLGTQISRDYHARKPLLIGILKGSVVFLADLVRRITCDVEVDFISISSYGDGTVSSGTVRLLKDLDRDIGGRHVLIVEDIVDTGLSLSYIRRNLEARNPASLAIAALLDKREKRQEGVRVEYVGFEVPDAFVVGYGLDYRERYRGLPYIGVMGESDLAEAGRPGGAA
jgi:hypoxanthine phosphoribosyltransferase